MKTPTKITLEEFGRTNTAYLADRCARRDITDDLGHVHQVPLVTGALVSMKPRYICQNCGAEIQYVLTYLSVHDSPFADVCAGTGRVMRMPIPYCPNCEERPALHGCLHAHPVQTCAK